MMYPTPISAGDIVFIVKGGGVQSSVVHDLSPERAHLLPLHEQGEETIKVGDLITRHKYRREDLLVMPAAKKKTTTKGKVKADNAKAKKSKATEDDEDDDEDEEDEDEEEAPKKKVGKAKAKASDDDDEDDDDSDDDDDDDDDEKPAKKSKKSDDDDDDDDDDDEDEKPTKKKSKAKKSDDDDDNEDEDEDDDEDDKKSKKKSKKKSSGKRGPKEVDPSKPMGRTGTKRRALFDAMRKGGTPQEIIEKAIEIDGEDGKVSKEDKQKYKNMGSAAIKGFAKSLGERGYDVNINEKTGNIKVSLKK